jgi:hypothetical protein
LLTCLSAAPLACDDDDKDNASDPNLIAQGKETFRNDTFGDEAFWTDKLQMHTVISTAVDPMTALGVGLKVDADALPPGILGMVDLTSPATTVALLKMNAVLGIKGEVVAGATGDQLMRVGITCALCHSSVDNSVMPGIGHRVIWTRVRSSRCRRRSPTSRRRSTTRGGRASTTRATTSTG